MGIEITIFTPTYNRRKEIINLYNSLQMQTCKKFEWLVVDDGSNDNTKGLFEDLIQNTSDFTIRYYYKDNGGKHRAINYGVEKANGRLFFIVDSDDYITNDAIESILDEEVRTEEDYKLAGFGFNKGEDEYSIVGDTFIGESIISSSIDRWKHNIKGDKAEIFYTQILKKYKFPEFSGENFITESVVWYRIANDGYFIKWINKIIYICEYLEGGLSKNAINLAVNNFKGYTYSVQQLLKYNLSTREKMILIGVYTRIARVKKITFYNISKNIEQDILICIIMGLASNISRFIKVGINKSKVSNKSQ